VTCDDFLSAMQEANGVDLRQFHRWYSQAGTPTVTVTTSYDKVHHTLALTLQQYDPNQTQPLLIPIKIGLLDEISG
jgi:aminopeptidase N